MEAAQQAHLERAQLTDEQLGDIMKELRNGVPGGGSSAHECVSNEKKDGALPPAPSLRVVDEGTSGSSKDSTNGDDGIGGGVGLTLMLVQQQKMMSVLELVRPINSSSNVIRNNCLCSRGRLLVRVSCIIDM